MIKISLVRIKRYELEQQTAVQVSATGRFYQSQVMNISISTQNLQTKPNQILYQLKGDLFARVEFHLINPKIKCKTSITQRKNTY